MRKRLAVDPFECGFRPIKTMDQKYFAQRLLVLSLKFSKNNSSFWKRDFFKK